MKDDGNVDDAFIYSGYSNWKNSSGNKGGFSCHERSRSMNLELNKCRGQCYDAASNMAGIRNGTATQILKGEPRAVYTHCYGHALNLAACDTVRSKRCYVTHLI